MLPVKTRRHAALPECAEFRIGVGPAPRRKKLSTTSREGAGLCAMNALLRPYPLRRSKTVSAVLCNPNRRCLALVANRIAQEARCRHDT
jgi:hypothetical protein